VSPAVAAARPAAILASSAGTLIVAATSKTGRQNKSKRVVLIIVQIVGMTKLRQRYFYYPTISKGESVELEFLS
jgi:hypothetical protein